MFKYITQWFKKRKINKLKKKATAWYEFYNGVADSYDCGLTLAEHLSPRLRLAKHSFNEALEELAELGEPVIMYKL